jgi:diketogulonate reductase-like aldo/keto reductase
LKAVSYNPGDWLLGILIIGPSNITEVGGETGKTPSHVALAWTRLNPAVTAPIIGARTLKQLEDDLGALQVKLTKEQHARLETVSAIEFGFPHDFLARPMTRNEIFGGIEVPTRD